MKLLANPIGLKTMFGREVGRFLKFYIQNLISPILTNMLFLGVFGATFATRSVGASGEEYLAFLVPGLCTMAALNSSFQNPSGSLMIMKYQNVLQDLNAYPMTDFEKVIAIVGAGTVRGVTVAVLTYLATIPFVGWQIHHPVGFVAMLTCISVLFSSIGLMMGLYAKTFDSITFVQTIIIMPLTFFGGVFFEVTKLPSFVAGLVRFNPIFPMVDSVRYMYLGSTEASIVLNVSLAAMFSLAVFCTAYRVFVSGYGLRT